MEFYKTVGGVVGTRGTDKRKSNDVGRRKKKRAQSLESANENLINSRRTRRGERLMLRWRADRLKKRREKKLRVSSEAGTRDKDQPAAETTGMNTKFRRNKIVSRKDEIALLARVRIPTQ